MVRTTACRHCSKLKRESPLCAPTPFALTCALTGCTSATITRPVVRCARPNNASPCDRCVESNLPCENPSNSTQPAAPAAASTRRSSCEQWYVVAL